jgi:cell division protein ZapA
MRGNTTPVTVQILDKEYRIACPEDERDSLLSSANYLNQKMKEVRDTGRVIGVDRIAVMTALNIAHESLQNKTLKESFSQTINQRLQLLQRRLESTVNSCKLVEM